MATGLVLLLVVAVAPGVDHPPASHAVVKSNAASAVQYESNRRVSYEQTEHVAGNSTDIPSSSMKSGKEFSSRRTHGRQAQHGLRLASAHAGENVVSGGETVEYEAAPIAAVSGEVGYQDCGCSDCAPRGHHHCSVWGVVGLGCPCHSPGDMTQHVPYLAHPKNYYYFRPYQYFHIADHQREVANYGGNPKHPYANRLFERVYSRTVDHYDELEDEAEPITPLRPLRRR